MNTKLKSILHNAWNEPRQFFLWLTLLSILGCGAMVWGLSFMPYEQLRSGFGLLLCFVLLGSAICFFISLLAFVVAWIPPVRRLQSWLLGRRFLILAGLLTLVALFYAIEDWRGRHAWQSFKRDREAKGEQFTLAELVPPPVPADQNFFESPLWQDLHWLETKGAGTPDMSEAAARPVFTIYIPDSDQSPGIGDWPLAQPVNLAAWQGYYRGVSNDVAKADDLKRAQTPEMKAFNRRYGIRPDRVPAPTNYFAFPNTPGAPAADVLLALSRFETNRQLLIETAARPQARFWVNYAAGYAMLQPHLARVKAAAQYLSLHASASLKAGDRAAALQDVTLALRLMETIRHEPSLISHLVGIAVLHITLQPVWEGLADRQWTATDLSTIEAELGKEDFLADYEAAMRAERACNLWGIDYLSKGGIETLNQLGGTDQLGDRGGLDDWLGRALFRLIPSGWFAQNKLSIARNHERYILPAVDADRRLVFPEVSQRGEAAMATEPIRPYDAFSRMLMPALIKPVTRFARAQTSVNLARIACALERYRLANGQFPETLGPLAPIYLDKLPHDIMNGEPLKYRRTEDGQFVLYSVGWDGRDDGGVVALTKAGHVDVAKGDWVWRYSAK